MRLGVALAWGALVCVACGSRTKTASVGLVGRPCQSILEDDPDFSGFRLDDFYVEPNNAACTGGAVCLVAQFRGRATCPYGGSCTTPSGKPVNKSTEPQCTDRRPSDAIYCSCKCGDVKGTDGGSACICPSGYTCTLLKQPFAMDGESYCVKDTTELDSASVCASSCRQPDQPCN
jgi:hypothetical protein